MRRWTGPDYEMWDAIHDDCPPVAECCSVLLLEVTDEVWREISAAAYILGLPLRGFVMHAIREVLPRLMRESA